MGSCLAATLSPWQVLCWLVARVETSGALSTRPVRSRLLEAALMAPDHTVLTLLHGAYACHSNTRVVQINFAKSKHLVVAQLSIQHDTPLACLCSLVPKTL